METYRCSQCHREVPKGSDCPHCGGKIRESVGD